MVDPTEVTGWLSAGKSVVDIMKSAMDLMPKGSDKESLARKILETEKAIKRADATLAKELGYSICECDWPPEIMLWKEQQQLFVCPNPNCGRTAPRGMVISDEVLRWSSQKPPNQR
jgi:hypothetical protein